MLQAQQEGIDGQPVEQDSLFINVTQKNKASNYSSHASVIFIAENKWMANTFFRFKKFTIHQDQCGMKVTTDGCLFGAVAASEFNTSEKLRVLDIGAGTGLLSLMFSQKNEYALIDAVELDEAAATQAAENFGSSIFKDRLTIHNADILQFEGRRTYDLIITNPPFYANELKGPDEKKNRAHHDTGLTLLQLIKEIERLLNPGGKFGILLPHFKMAMFENQANESGFYCYKKYAVKQTPRHPVFRNILFFSKEKNKCHEELLIIKTPDEYSQGFLSLLKEYYLEL